MVYLFLVSLKLLKIKIKFSLLRNQLFFSTLNKKIPLFTIKDNSLFTKNVTCSPLRLSIKQKNLLGVIFRNKI